MAGSGGKDRPEVNRSYPDSPPVRQALPRTASLEAEFQELYDTLARGLELVALRALGDRDEARDVVQESLARAFEAVRRGEVPTGVPLGAFVRGIARNVAADVLRRRSRSRATSLEDASTITSGHPNVLELLIAEERAEQVASALARLPRPDQELLEQCLLDGERIVEVAARLGVPAERIRKQKSRALQRLRELLQSGQSRSRPGDDT